MTPLLHEEALILSLILQGVARRKPLSSRCRAGWDWKAAIGGPVGALHEPCHLGSYSEWDSLPASVRRQRQMVVERSRLRIGMSALFLQWAVGSSERGQEADLDVARGGSCQVWPSPAGPNLEHHRHRSRASAPIAENSCKFCWQVLVRVFPTAPQHHSSSPAQTQRHMRR